ncbi:glycosyltransferase [Thioalkalivibrio sp. AKL7]|uniref:glycosyltransferase n=1 Tax=Thioalkalivibrio sp. AKL7 TaxID=1158155 RepID=UPI00036FB4C8|nr:glycosyltransferase [Thioalkalivibrio sp. AKL7]
MLTSTLPRWEGDTEPRFVLDLARSLSPDAQVELLAPHTPGAARAETLEGIPVQRYRYWIPRWQAAAYQGGMTQRLRENPWRLFQLPTFFLSQLWAITRRLRREPAIDLIHAHWLIPQGLIAILARALAGRRHIPVICTSHGGDLFALRGRWMTRLKRWVVSHCDATTVVSPAMVEPLQALKPRSPPVVIPMGTDLQGLFTPGDNNTARQDKHLVFVGRLVEKKGLSGLLEALAQFGEDERPTLDIIGDGPLRPQLETLARKLDLDSSVHFLGATPHAQLPAHYRKASIAVFPFVEAADGDQEGFGLVIVEAMGCGCAVIASDLPAIRHAIPSPDHGLRPTPGDCHALLRDIRSLLADKTLKDRLACQGRQHALAHFDHASTRDAFLGVYRNLAPGRGSVPPRSSA